MVGPLYLLVSPVLTKAPKEVQFVQKEMQKQVPSFKDLQAVLKVMSAPAPAPSFFGSLIKNIKEIITILSSSVGLILGARELRKEKVKRRTNPAPRKEPAKKKPVKRGYL